MPDNLDATKLGRVAYMTAGIAWTLAALPDDEAAKLPALDIVALADHAAATAHAAFAGGWSKDDRWLAEREAFATGLDELASIAALWPTTTAKVRQEASAFAKLIAGAPWQGTPTGPSDARVPVRTAAVRGPLDVYYYDHLAVALGDPARTPTALEARSDVLAYEALNLIDGHRTVSDIRNILTGRYQPVPLAEVADWLDLLAKAGVITYRTH